VVSCSSGVTDLLESFGCDMEHLVGWRGKRRRCHTLVACPIASPFGEVLAGFDTRLDTPPSLSRRHLDSSLARELAIGRGSSRHNLVFV
jgi:hypothetical protein